MLLSSYIANDLSWATCLSIKHIILSVFSSAGLWEFDLPVSLPSYSVRFTQFICSLLYLIYLYFTVLNLIVHYCTGFIDTRLYLILFILNWTQFIGTLWYLVYWCFCLHDTQLLNLIVLCLYFPVLNSFVLYCSLFTCTLLYSIYFYFTVPIYLYFTIFYLFVFYCPYSIVLYCLYLFVLCYILFIFIYCNLIVLYCAWFIVLTIWGLLHAIIRMGLTLWLTFTMIVYNNSRIS